MDEVFLKPGEIYYSRTSMLIRTILGSCVSVVIYDQRQKCGGMIHYLLPRGKNQEMEVFPDKYGETAIPHLLSIFKNRFKSKRDDLVVKVIGGSRMNSDRQEINIVNVGGNNIRTAQDVLRKYGLKIDGEHLAGERGRKVEFNTYTGELRFKYIENILQNQKEEHPVRVLIVDDSKPVRMLLRRIIEGNSDFEIAGEAQDPYQAMEIRKKEKVDVITLDINMPRMDGVTYLKKYMVNDPVPTIIITDYNDLSSGPVCEALEHGAFDYIKKPSLDEIKERGLEISDKIRAAFKTVGQQKTLFSQALLSNMTKSYIDASEERLDNTLIVLGASTGGTEAIKNILVKLPKNIPPILIVQHIPAFFSKAFADRLNELCSFSVKEAQGGDIIQKGMAYVAPGGQHMKISGTKSKMIITLNEDLPVNRFRPSVDYLFNSACQVQDKHIVALLLTGMGNDGAYGMSSLHNRGADTIAQDELSSIVFGMPQAAIDLNAVDHVLSLDSIANKLIELIEKGRKCTSKYGKKQVS